MNVTKCLRSHPLGGLFLVFALFFAHPFLNAEEDVEVSVGVLGATGAGKFNPANITRDENRAIQAAFGGTGGDALWQLAVAEDGAVYVVGTFGGDGTTECSLPGSTAGGPGFIARLSPDFRTMEKLFRLPGFATGRCIDIGDDGRIVVAGETADGQLIAARVLPDLSEVVWKKEVRGDRVASVSVAPDGSVVVCPTEDPFVSRITADGMALMPFGPSDTFRTDGGNPAVKAAWWDGGGYPAAGYTRGATYHRGGSGGVQALSDGTFVLFTTNFLYHPGGGPDFDPMLLRFDSEGRILWCTNLLEALPAESDQKQPHLAVDPFNGDLLLSAIQHGHFTNNLIASPSAFLTPDAWFTADIMIGWIARVDPVTGKVKAATFYFPEIPGPIVHGKRRANSLFPRAPAADASGRVYVTGATAYKLPTTIDALQPEPLGGSGFVAVFNADFSRLHYSSLITSEGYSMRGHSIVAAEKGPAVVGSFERDQKEPADFFSTNADVTDFLVPVPSFDKGAFFGFYPGAGRMVP